MRLGSVRALPPLSIALLLVVACDVAGPGEQQLPGLIDPADPSAVTVPDSVRVGASMVVTVVTQGGGCTQRGDTEVSVSGQTAHVTPYDLYPILRAGVACPGTVGPITHSADLSFSTPGDAQVVVHGRDVVSLAPVELMYEVVVW